MNIKTFSAVSIASLSAGFASPVLSDVERLTVKSSALGQSVSVISAEDLEVKRESSIGETLSNLPGVSSNYFGPGASRPIIRGLGSNRVKVMSNGVDSLDVSNASDDHAVSIEPYFAQEVEIIRGPQSLRYGPSAVGGVVNVVGSDLLNKLPNKPFSFDLDLEHAGVSDGNTAALQLQGATNSFGWSVSGLNRDTNDYDIDGFANEDEPENRGRLRNSDIDTEAYGFGGAYFGDQGSISFAYNRFDTDYGVPGSEEGDIRIDMEQDRYDLDGVLQLQWGAIDQLQFRGAYNDYEHFEREESGDIATTFENEELEARVELLSSYGNASQQIFGLQYNDREFSAEGEEAFIEPVDSESFGLFAINKIQGSRWDLEFGARVDTIDMDPDTQSDKSFDTYSLSLGALYALNDNTKLNFFLSRSERAPEEIALFADGPHLATLTFEVGNRDVDEETWYSAEVGVEQQLGQAQWKLSTFYNQVDDYIFLASVDGNNDGIADLVDEDGMLDPMGELVLGEYLNRDARFYGIEAEVSGPLFALGQSSLDGRLFGDLTRAKFREDGSDDVPRIPPARLGLGLSTQAGSWYTGMDLVHSFKQNREGDLETDTDAFTMLTLFGQKEISLNATKAKLFVRGENLLDEDARRHSSFLKDRAPLPGRGITTGISFAY